MIKFLTTTYQIVKFTNGMYAARPCIDLKYFQIPIDGFVDKDDGTHTWDWRFASSQSVTRWCCVETLDEAKGVAIKHYKYEQQKMKYQKKEKLKIESRFVFNVKDHANE